MAGWLGRIPDRRRIAPTAPVVGQIGAYVEPDAAYRVVADPEDWRGRPGGRPGKGILRLVSLASERLAMPMGFSVIIESARLGP